MTQQAATGTEDRALALLGSGVASSAVAAALGVSESRISQLLANEEFAAQVSTLRYENLQKHNSRDSAYDSLEDRLLDKLEGSMGLMFRPAEIAKTLALINGAKRRGQTNPDTAPNQQNVVTLLLPTQVTQKFITNVNNQVVSAGAQDLLTMQSVNLLNLTEEKEATQELTHESEPETAESLNL